MLLQSQYLFKLEGGRGVSAVVRALEISLSLEGEGWGEGEILTVNGFANMESTPPP